MNTQWTQSSVADHDPIYRASPNYILREIIGEWVLVSVGQGVADFCGIVKLNASAKVLWETLQIGATKADLVQALMDAFSVSQEQAEADVAQTLELLQQREMVSYE